MPVRASTGEVRRAFSVIEVKGRKLWYGLNSHFVILTVHFDPNAAIPYRTGRCYCRPAAHKRIKDNPFPQGKGGTNNLPHERLRFQGWMRSDFSLYPSGRSAFDDIPKRLLLRETPQAACLPFTKIILHSTSTGLSKEPPRFPTGARHDGDVLKFFMGILWSVTTPEGLYEADNLSSFLEAGLFQGSINEMGEERVGRNEHMSAWDENALNSYRPLCKELL